MRCLVALAVLLSACSCSNQPLVPQHEVDSVKAAYQAAAGAEARYRSLPPCIVALQVACFDSKTAEHIRIAQYNAAAALVTADQERTAGAMAKAREEVARFTAEANGQ